MQDCLLQLSEVLPLPPPSQRLPWPPSVMGDKSPWSDDGGVFECRITNLSLLPLELLSCFTFRLDPFSRLLDCLPGASLVLQEISLKACDLNQWSSALDYDYDQIDAI